MTSIYEDDTVVADVTRRALEETGSRLLQIHRFHEDEAWHVKELLEIFNPSPLTRIADVGCGVGRLAEMMKELRSDLDFVLINPSASQLSMCPAQFEKRCATAEDMPLTKGYVDAVMVTYALGHIDLERFIKECERMMVSQVFLFDLFKLDMSFERCRLKRDLDYTERTISEIISAFADGGYNLIRLDTTQFAPVKIKRMLPAADTLNNSVSAAMTFELEL